MGVRERGAEGFGLAWPVRQRRRRRNFMMIPSPNCDNANAAAGVIPPPAPHTNLQIVSIELSAIYVTATRT